MMNSSHQWSSVVFVTVNPPDYHQLMFSVVFDNLRLSSVIFDDPPSNCELIIRPNVDVFPQPAK